MRVVSRLLKRPCLSMVLLGSIGAAATAVPATALAAPTGSRVVGHVYVNDNTAGSNTIGAFDRHADGSLTPEAGSPFSAGGAGTGSGLASQGAIQVTSNGRYLIAVDPGSNQISVLRIQHDGSLSLTSVSSSGGQLPVSVAVYHHLVYVANASPTSPSYTGFSLHHGQLDRAGRLDGRAGERLSAHRCPVQRHRPQAGRYRGEAHRRSTASPWVTTAC